MKRQDFSIVKARPVAEPSEEFSGTRHVWKLGFICFGRILAQHAAECLDLSAVTQGGTLDEVTATICEAIGLYLEGEDLAELGFAENPAVVTMMELGAVA
jgi:hypothetical protein